ncbi:MAG TPA: TonB-dependent receptor plug domain-containing protein, partial [Flavisolibacter sp.]|nr:TonB-dependent receptor plug domain-containing protein [Flavisolibacter sp.]
MRMNQFPKLTALLVIFLALFQTSFAQNHTVTGKVTDPNGVGIPGVTVAVRGSSISTQTASDGTYQITAPENSALVFSSVGYNTMELSTSGRSAVDATLSTSANSLNEVVVIGYGTARRRDVTGAVTTVTSKQFNQGVIISPDQLLQNKVAGVDITSNSGQPGAATTIKIRGNTSIRASQNPLYVIDGVPLDGRSARPSVNLGNNGLGFGTTPESNPLLYINPNDIAQIDILKDASAAAIYGSRGANGVIVITTKKGSAGAAKIEVGANTSVSGYMKKYEVLTASQYRSALTKYSIPTSNDAGASVDALKEIAQHTPSQSYNVAFSGGNETGKFRASFLGSR